MAYFIAGAFFGASVMFAALVFTRRQNLPAVVENAETLWRQAEVLDQDEARDIAAVSDAKESDKELTFDDIYGGDSSR